MTFRRSETPATCINRKNPDNTEGNGDGELISNMTATDNELLYSLVDIRSVKIDCSQPAEERMKSYIEQIKKLYLFKVGKAVVHVAYADTEHTINDSFINLTEGM